MSTLQPFGDGGKRHQQARSNVFGRLAECGLEIAVASDDLYRSEADRLTQKLFTPTVSALIDWLIFMSEGAGQ